MGGGGLSHAGNSARPILAYLFQILQLQPHRRQMLLPYGVRFQVPQGARDLGQPACARYPQSAVAGGGHARKSFQLRLVGPAQQRGFRAS